MLELGGLWKLKKTQHALNGEKDYVLLYSKFNSRVVLLV